MNVEDIVNEGLLKEQEARKDRVRSGKMNPSSFGQCRRRQYWNRKNETETNPPSVKLLRIFKAGVWFHEGIQKFLPSHQCEVEVSNEDIRGFADIVTDEMVIDIKTQNSFQFKLMGKDTFDIEKEKPDYIIQLMTYCYFLHKRKGKLVFVGKDNFDIREFEFEMRHWRDRVLEEIDTNKDLWVKGFLPPAEPRLYKDKKTGKSQEGKYCQFRNKCLEGGWDCVGMKNVDIIF